ncbi:hypothetical protein FOA52_014491 [Chlamydomonas sp. UWO 241]|nr:hypothetical protein FOA52_014491 [Chlamydomonas sp. UWO 241]
MKAISGAGRVRRSPSSGARSAAEMARPASCNVVVSSMGMGMVGPRSQSSRRRVSSRAASVESKEVAGEDAAPSYNGIIMEPKQRPTGLRVRVRSMYKNYTTAKGVFQAVNNVDVDVEPSTIVALLGPSGSGKTTLLRLIAGLETPTGGSILFDDFDATDTPVQDRHIGFVFQSYALFNHRTVAENIKFGLEVRNIQVDHAKRVDDLIQLVQLDGLGDRYPRQLSGGQRQRVAMARALASNPKLLLLDEPFGALDAVVRKSLRAGLKEIVRSVGVTTVIVTHDQEEAFDLADKVVIFNRGRVEQMGTPNEIIKSPRTPFIMKFVGETNIVPANCQFVKRMRFTATKSKVMFRPSDIQIFKTPQAPSLTADGSVLTLAPAVVSERHNLGWVIKYTLTFDDGVSVELTATRQRDETELNLEEGQRVFLHVPPKNMMAFEQPEIESTPML